ncbi:MAG: TetR/AcrR family transcriptional regulator [Gemmatimonadaceae bacterium]
MATLPDTKVAILDAAEARFAAQGFVPTTIKQIAGDAGVNSALLYYYFADKEALYGEVVTRLITRMAGAMSSVLASADGPAAAIERFATQHNEMLERLPHLRKIVGRELIDHDAAHAQDAIRHLAATTFARLRAAIGAGQQAGIFRDDLDPRFVAISLVAQTTYFEIARPAVELLIADGKPISADVGAAFARHAAAFTLAALAPPRHPSPTD